MDPKIRKGASYIQEESPQFLWLLGSAVIANLWLTVRCCINQGKRVNKKIVQSGFWQHPNTTLEPFTHLPPKSL